LAVILAAAQAVPALVAKMSVTMEVIARRPVQAGGTAHTLLSKVAAFCF
jgi:hypothetical protein